MTYPATTYAEGVELTITSGNQLHEIINGDATEEINTESGMVPSVRKALADSMLFKPAIAWAEGSVESDPFQTRLYGEGIYWAPAASNETPISMGTNPNIDGNWFLAPVTGFDSIASNTNLLSNHNFILQSPDDITHPSVTPTDYVAGTQVFSGVFVGDDIVGLTYIDGRVSWTSGTLYFSVPNSGALEYVDQTEFVASVADFDGKPRTRGVSYSLVGDEYRVTVGVDALSDGVDDTPLGSVKFEQGKMTTGHEVSPSYVQLQSVARSLNVPDSDVTYANSGEIVAKYIYDAVAQKTWGVPADAIGETIISVSSSGELVTNSGAYQLSYLTHVSLEYVDDSISALDVDITSNTARLDITEPKIAALEENQQSGVIVFQTYALLDAYTPTPTEQRGSFKVTNDPDKALNGYYSWVNGTTYTKDASLVVNEIDEANTSDAVSGAAVHNYTQPTISKVDVYLDKPSYNLIDISAIRQDRRVSPFENGIIVAAGSTCSDYIPVEQGETYWFSGVYEAYWFTDNSDSGTYIGIAANGLTPPENAKFIVCTTYNITLNKPEDQTVPMLTVGKVNHTEYVPYKPATSIDGVFGLMDELASKTDRDEVFSVTSKNLLNKEKVENLYYSPANNAMLPSNSYRTVRCDIKEGESYTISGVMGGVSAISTDADGSDILYSFDNSLPEIVAPTGAKYMFVVIAKGLVEGEDTPFLDTAMLRISSTPSGYEEYGQKIDLNDVTDTKFLMNSTEFTSEVSTGGMIDLTKIDYVNRYSEAPNTIVVDTLGIAMTDAIPVQVGETYTLAGSGYYGQGGFLDSDKRTVGVSLSPIVSGNSFTVPDGHGIAYVVVSLNKLNKDPAETSLDGPVQMVAGTVGDEDAVYVEPTTLLLDEVMPIKYQDMLVEDSFNKINPAKIDYVKRYSTANLGFKVDTVGIASTEFIPVVEGEYYAVSGGYYGQGGYFAKDGDTNAIANITFFTPVSGIGKNFQVPMGSGIKFVVLSLRKLNNDPEETELQEPAQLEEGEVPTSFVPYEIETKINKDYLPVTQETGKVSFNDRVWFTYTEGDEGGYLTDKLPNFRRDYLLRERDLCVVNSGTSLTARSTEHSTPHNEASIRPPLFHSNNYASIMWDKLKWEGQSYRRYDTGIFTESVGSWITATSVGESGDWDDDGYRNGLTRYTEGGNAVLAYAIPDSAWQCNFIFRSDSESGNATVTISEGVGKVVCLDSSGNWVEANGFVLDMNESPRVSRDILVPDPSSLTNTPRTLNVPSKGNTTYQKRLKMKRIDDRVGGIGVTLTQTSGTRFCYWGIEYSEREHMITFINAARGSHATNVKTAESRALPLFADNEVWGFKPDLILSENPMHNDGAANANAQPYKYHERITDNFITNTDYELSMYSRAAHFGLSPEYVFFTSSITWNFGGITDDGQLMMKEQDNGSVISALDKYNQAHYFLIANHPEIVSINGAKRWVDAGLAIYGNLREATEGSGKDGATFTNEGSHWNDTGSKIIAKVVASAIDFTRS